MALILTGAGSFAAINCLAGTSGETWRPVELGLLLFLFALGVSTSLFGETEDAVELESETGMRVAIAAVPAD